MIVVTEAASKQIQTLVEESGFTTPYLRVAVKGGGCSGLSYDLSFDTDVKQTDMLFEDKDVKVIVDNKSLLYLFGTELDYSGGLNGKGFEFKNPNASRTCGCGESFSL
jgi:iron-sulfur cluster assembly protein